MKQDVIMAHEDKGHYAAKHKGKQVHETIAEKIGVLSSGNNITCAAAHRAGKELNRSPLDIGIQIDLLEYRIAECQLGLFGYTGGQKKMDPDIHITPELNNFLDTASRDGRISCLECWDIAKKLKLNRLDLGSACEKKNIRIKPCQLGAF